MAREDAEDISYIVDGSGPDGKLQTRSDDLRNDIKQTLAEYLHCLTSDAPDNNQYEVPSGFEEGSYRDPEGNPAAIQTGAPYRQNAYSTDPSLETWSNPFLDALAETISVSDYLAKGQTGHTTLQDVAGKNKNRTGNATAPDGNTQVEKQVSQVLRNNRWNPTPGNTPYVTGDGIPDLEVYVPNESSLGAATDPVTGEPLSTPVNIETLRKVALSLMLKATGDDPNGTQDPDNANPLLPTLVQLGSSRIEPAELDARKAFGVNDLSRVSLDSDFARPAGDDEFKSYGNLNSYLEPFGGFLPLGMIALAAATTVALIVASQVIFGLLAVIVSTDAKTVRLDPGPYIMGQYGKPEPSGLLGTLVSPQTLGLIHTENDFPDAARRGANIFFGFSGDNLGEAVADSLLNILTAPGYYAVTTRAIFRSLNTISNAIKDIDFSNPVGGTQAVLGMVDVIRSSKVIAFFNVIAGLGDTAIKLEQTGYVVEPGAKTKISFVDDLVDNPATRVMKSRANNGPSAMTLAWRTSATPGAYLLPSSLFTAAADFKGDQKVIENLLGTSLADATWEDEVGSSRSSLMTARDLKGGRRIRRSIVEKIENALEAEYMPFYFHDLRTNEIVSFHAFLGSLTDQYSANYESTNAYGRIDPVRTYQNTERSVGFSFTIAATNREDFDVMWWKVNKLITLLYPQWSKGRSVTNSNEGYFIQPFTQIPTASPLIRLRIGDTIKSNYSKFNLARTFGLGTDQFKPDPAVDSSEFGEKITATLIDNATSIVTRMSRDPDVNNDGVSGFTIGDRAILLPTRNGFYLEADPSGNAFEKAAAIITTGAASRKLKTIQEYNIEVTDVEQIPIDRRSTLLNRPTKTRYKVKFVDEPPRGFEEVELYVTHADLRVNPDWIIQALGVYETLNELQNSESGPASVNDNFFSPRSNPVVRAFESAGGRGLAGVITTMNFDWFEPTWEIDVGARAPQWCKIDVSFSPIHDIPPGLDADGFNRAPVYPVGAVGEMSGDIYDGESDFVKDLYRLIRRTIDNQLSSTGE